MAWLPFSFFGTTVLLIICIKIRTVSLQFRRQGLPDNGHLPGFMTIHVFTRSSSRSAYRKGAGSDIGCPALSVVGCGVLVA